MGDHRCKAKPVAASSSDKSPEGGEADSPVNHWQPQPDLKVSIAHLPQPGKHFVGRKDELAILDNAWLDPKKNIVEFVAFGGVGKSALVAEWLKQMQADDYRGAARVFGHSFYSQGSREDAQASADSFLDRALRFFGDPDPTEGSPWDKGERLAQLVRKQPTLLILDGVEPLQSPEATDDAGQIRDPGLQALIRELASRNTGLLVISTRARIRDIVGRENSSVVSHSLDYLSIEAGTELLKVIGVQGTDEELGVAVEEVGGHALSVTLVGKYVTRAANGHIEDRYEIGIPRVDLVARSPDENTEDAADSLQTAVTPDVVQIGKTLVPGAGKRRNKDHVAKTFSRIMKRYEVWLWGLKVGEEDIEVRGRLALEIVRLTGLFDRPMTAGEFVALIKGVTIKPPREQTLFEKAWDARRQNMEGVQMALQVMQMQATDDEKAKINEALEARPQDIDGLKAISQDIAKREDSSSEETEEAVTIEGPIEGLTDLASVATEDEVNLAVDRLVEYGLITNVADSRIQLNVPAWPDPAAGAVVLDGHPLVREHFAEQLEQEHKSSSVEAHRRLYEHLKQSAPELPDNLNDMIPLYHAVVHGCKAGLVQESLIGVYYSRIQRDGKQNYAMQRLGVVGQELAMLSSFFAERWLKPLDVLSLDHQDWILSVTGFRLRALGQLPKTKQPMEAALKLSVNREVWNDAAVEASNLSELSLTLGDVSSAVRQGEQSVELADRSGDAFWRMSDRTTLADALRCASGTRSVSGKALAAGDAGSDSKEPAASALRLTALAAFREAEAMQKERQPQYPQLYSLPGYRYCELLLEQCRGSHASRIQHAQSGDGERRTGTPARHEGDEADGQECPSYEEQTLAQLREVRTRAETTLKWVTDAGTGILDQALDHLTLGRTWLLEAQCLNTQFVRSPNHAEPSDAAREVSDSLTHATTHLNESVDLLRQGGQQQELPRGLLHRAALWRVMLEAGATAGSPSSAEEARLGKPTEAPSPEELLDKANKDLTEVETIAERGSMLIWQIEAALERSQLFLTLAHLEKRNRRFTHMNHCLIGVHLRPSAVRSRPPTAHHGWNRLAKNWTKLNDSSNKPRSPTNLTSPTGKIGNHPNTSASSKRATSSATTAATKKSNSSPERSKHCPTQSDRDVCWSDVRRSSRTTSLMSSF